jgi:hypothetical protein
LKRNLIQVLLVFAIVLAAWVGYGEHVRITAWVWHVRHGGVLRFGDYLVPVPANWYVNDDGSGGQVLIRLDQAKELSNDTPHIPATISLLEDSPLKDLNYWESFLTSVYEKRGTDPVLHREIDLEGETFKCVGGNALPASEVKKFPIPIGVSWDCRSSGSMEILIRGQEDDLSQAWGIVSHIRIGRRPNR